MFNLLIGDSFGKDPVNNISAIRAQKHDVARSLIYFLDIKKSDVALEIGAGCGYLSQVVAPEVQHLHCCDVSQSFLDVAAEECRGMDNISFKKITSGDLSHIPDQSVNVVYANNVFIHLNLFEIALYLRSFSRVVAPGGRAWFDLAFADSFKEAVPDHFLRMVDEFRETPSLVSGLFQFHSRLTVESLARHYGFEPTLQQIDSTSLRLIKK